jgi:hypothetical protein
MATFAEDAAVRVDGLNSKVYKAMVLEDSELVPTLTGQPSSRSLRDLGKRAVDGR